MANEDVGYLTWIRGMPCHECTAPAPCQAHHHTARRGTAQRAHDHDAIPLCARCHRNFHSGCGSFSPMTNKDRTEWQDAAVLLYRGIFNDEEAM